MKLLLYLTLQLPASEEGKATTYRKCGPHTRA
jgi:hypothetical protein